MEKVNKKIVFLLTNRKHSGVLKRVESFIEKGVDVEIYGFDRGFGKEINILKGIKIIDLGLVDNGKSYFSKIIRANFIFRKIFKKHSKNVIYYVFSFDFALLCFLNRKKYVYEIRDLVYGYFSSKIIINLFKIIDKLLIRFSLLTVVLSEGFVKFLYKNKKNKKIIIQPNKLHGFFKDTIRPEIENNSKSKITFGYIGFFRFPNTIMRFARVIGENFPNHKVMFFGDGIPEYKNMINNLVIKHDNIYNLGSFKNPEDLASIYEQVDISLSCYDNNFVNVRYAEPNKLYESIFFNTPIVVSENTFLGQKVLDLEIGFVLNSSKDIEILDYVNNLNFKAINKKKKHMAQLLSIDLIDDKATKIISYINKNDK